MTKYAPDLNPISPLFAKLKHGLRNPTERSHDAVCRAIAQILDSISAAKYAKDLANSSYDRI